MNKLYRIIWNEATQTWAAVAENAKGHGKSKSVSTSTSTLPRKAQGWGDLAAAVLTRLAQSVWQPLVLSLWTAGVVHAAGPALTQLPTGGQVVAGQASMAQSGAATLNVNQTSTSAVINWSTFNLGSAATVHFVQPSSSSATLNRVLDSNPSQIYGRITAPGQVFFTNPNGIYFAKGASADVGALTATTHSISNADFMAGHYRFSRDGASGKIVNEGELKASLGGYIALLAPEVRNQGVIVAQMGTVALAAGDVFELQMQGTQLSGLRVTPATIKALVENGQAVQAPGGLIVLSAQALNQLQGGVINTSGALQANTLVQRNGRIVLDASHKINVSGPIQVNNDTGKGGEITLTAEHIALQTGAQLQATGTAGGGTVLVGGDWQGGGNLRQATTVTMQAGASIDASATQSGDGGKVVLWSDIHNKDSLTNVQGSLTAQGGAAGGNGGNIETSGASLQIGSSVRVDTSAAAGQTGNWLLDHFNITHAEVSDGFEPVLFRLLDPEGEFSALLGVQGPAQLHRPGDSGERHGRNSGQGGSSRVGGSGKCAVGCGPESHCGNLARP
jgi:filamentous hemagglutinin family protein